MSFVLLRLTDEKTGSKKVRPTSRGLFSTLGLFSLVHTRLHRCHVLSEGPAALFSDLPHVEPSSSGLFLRH